MLEATAYVGDYCVCCRILHICIFWKLLIRIEATTYVGGHLYILWRLRVFTLEATTYVKSFFG